jgi:XTP/dITP diphosphohydrolase
MKTIVLATSNAGKIAELESILSPIHCIQQSSLNIVSPDETGLSFVENALIKARYASAMSKQPALADDSGLVVQSLQGAPGIYSARYAGEQANAEDNIHLLLENMESVPSERRQAFFYCAIVLVRQEYDPIPIIAFGQLSGIITSKPAGVAGFGYDPVFYLPEYKCTVAQLPAAIKNTISHRAQALEHLKKLVRFDEEE